MKILIIDDSAIARQRSIKILGVFNDIEFEEAGNGKEALGYLEFFSDEISLILCDLLMPEMGGVEFLKNLKEAKIHIPVVIVTTEQNKEMVVQCLLLGAKGYIVKPYDEKTLIKKVEDVLVAAGKKPAFKTGGPPADRPEHKKGADAGKG